MKNFIFLSLVFFATLFAYTAKAQVHPGSYWSVFGGVSVPTGEFGKAFYGDFLDGTIDNKAGFAKPATPSDWMAPGISIKRTGPSRQPFLTRTRDS